MAITSKPDTSYDEHSIQVLRDLEPVRKRPGMYIGDTDDGTGLHHMVTEVVDNSVDEASAGFCDRIIATIHDDGSISVEDNGRGIPTGIMEGEGEDGEGLAAATVIMTTLHAGGKFDDSSYDASGGLHGVGVSVVNALSEWLLMTIHREGSVHFQEYRNGVPVKPLEVIGDADRTGTKIQFLPSEEIFGSNVNFRYETLLSRLRELSFLNSGVHIELHDQREGMHRSEVLRHKGGIVAYVSYLNRSRIPVNEEIIYIKGEKDDIEIEVALQWSENYYSETLYCYTNNIHQIDGGKHKTGFRKAVTNKITAYVNRHVMAKNVNIEGEDTREGLASVLSVRMYEPRFSSQTKSKLVSSNVESAVSGVVADGLHEYLEENPKIARLICKKIVNAAKVRERVQKQKQLERKSVFGSTSLPGKLADCQETNPAESELFLVEGESAGGSAKQARDRKFQAILPLKGKILNVQKATLDKIVSSEEIQALIKALGAGFDMDFELDNLRYHRVIIMTDADVDGSHIRTLLLTFFYKKMPKLIEAGHLYIAQPPLYKAKFRNYEKYLSDDQELNDFILETAVKDAKIEMRNGTASSEEIKGDRLLELCVQRESAKKAVKQLKKRFEENLLRQLSRMPRLDPARFDDDSYLEGFIEKLDDGLSNGANVGAQYSFGVDSTDSGSMIKVTKNYMGEVQEFNLDKHFAESKIYQTLTKLSQVMNQYSSTGIRVQRGSKNTELDNLNDAVDWLLDDTRSGIAIQRYKGLGEMNADQLRETTMDVNERLLRKIKIEDAFRTEDAVHVLMGEEVRPRREFIETEALSVRNLDI